jgi:16S rRNA (cytosine1402-N4)-methyltransferase
LKSKGFESKINSVEGSVNLQFETQNKSSEIKFDHKTVLMRETVENLEIRPGGVYVDATAGGGGLSEKIAEILNGKGLLVCIDQDYEAIEECKARLKKYKNIFLVCENFVNIQKILSDLNIASVNGIVFDLGVSSYQLDNPNRGFSYKKDAGLDMRMSKSGISAFEVVNKFSRGELSKIIRTFGEEKYHGSIAKAICSQRRFSQIFTTLELAQIVCRAVPRSYREKGHPARKTFQALRIYVNSELENLDMGLDRSIDVLSKGGRLCVISFHSLEDKIVKRKMLEWQKNCSCPSDFPICVCGRVPKAEVITKKPVAPTFDEIQENSRSRSAKLRVCKKL